MYSTALDKLAMRAVWELHAPFEARDAGSNGEAVTVFESNSVVNLHSAAQLECQARLFRSPTEENAFKDRRLIKAGAVWYGMVWLYV